MHGLNNLETVGVSLWIGEKFPEYVRDCLVNNAKYFKDFYLITNKERDNVPGVIQLVHPIEELIEYIQEPYSSIRELIKDFIGPNYLSDLLTYNSKKILNSMTGKDYDLVMDLDTDFWIYSEFVLNNIFASYKDCNTLILGKDQNYYIQYDSKDYLNCCFSLDGKDSDDTEFLDIFKEYLTQPNFDPKRYTCIGPSFVIWKRSPYESIKNLVPHTFDPRYVYRGRMEETIVPGALGCHLVDSLIKETGHKLISVKESNFNKNLIVIIG